VKNKHEEISGINLKNLGPRICCQQSIAHMTPLGNYKEAFNKNGSGEKQIG
jgi:hypothetical protein